MQASTPVDKIFCARALLSAMVNTAGKHEGRNMLLRSPNRVFRQIAIAATLTLAAGIASAAADNKVTEEVIVKGTRPEVEKRVNKFVKGVTHRGYAVQSLVRWNKPICPLVAGTPAEQGEFMLQRISQAVHDAGARLDEDQKCKPNFHVVLTPEPISCWICGANARRSSTAWRRRRKCAASWASRGRFESGTTSGMCAARVSIRGRSSAPTRTSDCLRRRRTAPVA
jgi:hypothetical protein